MSRTGDAEGGDGRRRPGPRRAPGAPSGPDEVRRAVLDAAGRLFADHGIATVSLRRIAAEADVQVSLITRYLGTRDQLIDAVLDDLSAQLAAEVAGRPMAQLSFEPDSVIVRWTRLVNHFTLIGRPIPPVTAGINPMLALVRTLEEQYGLGNDAARLRAAQLAATAMGWRVFEDLLISWAGLEDVPRSVLHDELTSTIRRVGATPLPSPPDPTPQGSRD